MRRFALIHYRSEYYARMMGALASALRDESAVAETFPTNFEHPGAEMGAALAEFSPTDTLAVNWPRTRLPIPDSAMHHVWLQDRYWQDQSEIVDTSNQRIWYWVRRWGPSERWLPPATNFVPAILPKTPDYDVSFAGFIPDKLPPDIDPAFHAVMARAMNERTFTSDPETIRRWAGGAIDQGTHERLACFGMRYHQRQSALRALIDDGRFRVALWARYPPREFASVYRGWADTETTIMATHTGASVTLHLNGDTYGHTRVFDSLALGVPVLAEYVPGADNELAECDVDGVVRVFHGLRNMCTTLADMLANLDREREIAARGAMRIAEHHRWRQRARTLLA